MEWLHLSDFHVGRPKGPQTTALASLLESIKIACKKGTGRVDVVFITGDIAYSGKNDEYRKFCDDFLYPLKDLPEFSDTTIFAVPGNHDIDCDSALPITWDSIGKRNQDIFFCEDDDGKNARRGRAFSFEGYQKFVNENNIISPDPFSEVTSWFTDEIYPFDILSTNTAFFSDRDNNSSDEITPSPIESLRQVLIKNTPNKPIVILAHHPISCFIKNQQKPFSTFLREKKAAFFHGHEHAPKVTFGHDGTIRTIGFGACYLATLQENAPAPYQNTFTHCRLANRNELSIGCYSWQSESGTWIDSTAVHLPECIPEQDSDSEVVCLRFPSVLKSDSSINDTVPVSKIRRLAPRPSQLIAIDQPSLDVMKRLFLSSKNISTIYQKGEPDVQFVKHDDGKMECTLELPNGERYFLLVIGALNHILSSKEVESINTELDTQGFLNATVISFGKISSEAKSMYLRLQTRKPIEIVVNEGLAGQPERILSDQQRAVLANLDAAKHDVRILLGENEIYLLVINISGKNLRFNIISSVGSSIAATDPIVSRLRKGNPYFGPLSYAGEDQRISPTDQIEFQEIDYLRQCHSEYNVMKYAGLANVGIRFSALPLEDLYVNASACEMDEKAETRSEQLIDDHLATYEVSDELKSHIQKQLLSSVRKGNTKEKSRAREFCQMYSAVLVTGDPGSGKTCFVKNEILTYCKRAIDPGAATEVGTTDWHSNHIPVMMPLSKMVAEEDVDESGLFSVAERLLERRGLLFPEKEISKLASQGKMAFFFDGLDEVVSVEKRAIVVKHINNLVEKYLPIGNRIVVTSRPAAVQIVNLLPALHKLELQGLTENEMRLLARKLLSLKLGATQEDVLLDEGKLNDDDNVLINQLIEDCNRNPGVSRLAQNPLLLTLLIMIYANSGAPSAKRHRIYEEAIKTLASVRGREAGHQPISVQDLRERLGAVALSVFRKESGLLPSRREVCAIVKNVMERQRNENVSTVEANAFVQKVAESTGLIALEARHNEEEQQAIVTFMHHSFLEYFAAIGLSRELETIDFRFLVHKPRWHEILTLLSGIIGEIEDVSPIIQKILDSGSEQTDVDAKLLLFSIDCSLECEVPSEAAQRLISNEISSCLSKGSGRLDQWVRSEIGKRLQYLVNVCGGSEFDSMISALIRSGDESVSSAALDVAGYMCEEGYISNEILSAFEYACSQADDVILSAVCKAAGRSRKLRTNAALQVVTIGLRKSRRIKKAAFEAIADIPSIAIQQWGEILNGIEDKNQTINGWASVSAVRAGLNTDVISLSASRKDILLRALDCIDRISGYREFCNPQVKKETIEKLLSSSYSRDRTLGIRLLPMIENEEHFIYKNLFDFISDNSHREDTVAALSALRWSGSVLALITLNDLRKIINWLKEGTSDVRIAAAQLLGRFGSDKPAVQALLNQDYNSLSVDEYCESIMALSRAKTDVDSVKDLYVGQIQKILSENKKMNSSNLKRTFSLLDASKRLKFSAPSSLVKRIFSIIEDYRSHETLRKKALLCFPAISMPSIEVVKQIKHLILHPPIGMEHELVQTPSILANKCKQSVDFVIACVSGLRDLRNSLILYHGNLSKRIATDENEYYVTELRNGIKELTEIIVAFHDFIGEDNGIKYGDT